MRMSSLEKGDDDVCLNGRDDVLPLKSDCQTECNSQENRDQSNGLKLWVVYLLGMVPMIAIAMNVTSTWSYLQKIDPDVDPTFFGWANFGFYCSAIVTDIAIGRWMHFRASSREPLILLCFIQILAVLLYVFAQGVGGQGGLILVLVARILLGTQRGMMTITRTLISYSTDIKQRSQAMANNGISLTAGFFIGSGIQAAISQIGKSSFYLKSMKLHFNLYTIPSYLAIMIAVSTIIFVWYHIKPVIRQPCLEANTPSVKKDLMKRELCAGACLVLLFTLTSFAASSVETLTVPFVQHQFSLTEAEAVWYGGIVLTVQAVIATLQQGNIKILLKRFTDRWLILIGYASLCLAFMLYIPFGSVPAEMTASNSTLLASSTENIGCPKRYNWCSTSPRIWLPQFILGAVLQASGLSFCMTLVLSLYTKVLVGRNQGSSLGYLSAAGNFGRLIAPLASSSSYVAIGPQFTYLWIFLTLSLGMIYYIAVYKDMHPRRSMTCDDADLKRELKSNSNDTFYISTV